MAGIGDMIFNLMGKSSPRDELMKSIGSGMTTPPATSGGSEQPAAYQTPPDLMNLYTQLLERQDRNSMIEKGIGMLGASFAQPQNRANIVGAFSGGSGGGDGGGSGGSGAFDPLTFMTKVQEFQAGQDALNRRAQIRGTIPAIAKKYGLTEETANYLFETGKLDAIIAEAEKPDRQLVSADGVTSIYDVGDGKLISRFGTPKRDTELKETADGLMLIDKQAGTSKKVADLATVTELVDQGGGFKTLIDKNSGKTIKEFDSKEPPKTQVVTHNDGSSILYDLGDGTPIAQLMKAGGKPTDDMIEWSKHNEEQTKAGKPTIGLMDWLLQMKKAAAPKTTIGGGEKKFSEKAAEAKVKQLYEDYSAAKESTRAIGQARQVVNLAKTNNFAGDMTSPLFLDAAKVWSSYLGVGPETAQAITNTEQLRSALSEQVLPRVKELGTGNSISNADVKFTNDMVGSISTTPGAITNIALMMEKGGINKAIQYNEKIRKEIENRTKRDPEFDPSDMPDVVEIPPPSEELKALILQQNKIPPEAIADLRKNPTPERIKEFDAYYGEGSFVARILLGAY